MDFSFSVKKKWVSFLKLFQTRFFFQKHLCALQCKYFATWNTMFKNFWTMYIFNDKQNYKIINFSESLLKSVHFKNIVAWSSVLSKLWSFSIIHQLNLFWFQLINVLLKMIIILKELRTEDRATVFLKMNGLYQLYFFLLI